jgi:hypothetical protein
MIFFVLRIGPATSDGRENTGPFGRELPTLGSEKLRARSPQFLNDRENWALSHHEIADFVGKNLIFGIL